MSEHFIKKRIFGLLLRLFAPVKNFFITVGNMLRKELLALMDYKAPYLHHVGQKAHKTNFYMLPQELADIAFRVLSDKPAQLRVFIVLCGTAENFQITTSWICERANVSQPNYCRILKELEKLGWIEHKPYRYIKILYDNIYKAQK